MTDTIVRSPQSHDAVAFRLVEVAQSFLSRSNDDTATRFSDLLLQILQLPKPYLDHILNLREDVAQAVLDAFQAWLDRCPANHTLRRNVIYLLVKLSSHSNQLPKSLFVEGIEIGHSRDPTASGGFADIFCGTYAGAKVAVKRLRICNHQKAEIYKALCREALVWRQLKHSNVLSFIGVDACTFSETGHICMVAPWMAQGTILDYIQTDAYEARRDRDRLLADIARGLTYLHSQKIVHGDVKAANIFIDDSHHARIADFGLVIVGDATAGRMTTVRDSGTVQCMAPERLDPETEGSRQTPAGDVYAFGCLCYLLCTGRQPFSHLRSEYAVIVQVISGRRPSRPTGAECLEPGLSDELWELMERCWMHDPKQRPEMEKVLAYFAGCKNPGRPKIGSNSGTSSEVLRERHRPAAIQTSSSTASEAARGKRRARSPGSPPPQRAVKRVRIKKEEEVETNLQFGPQDEPDHRACQLCDRAKISCRFSPGEGSCDRCSAIETHCVAVIDKYSTDSTPSPDTASSSSIEEDWGSTASEWMVHDPNTLAKLLTDYDIGRRLLELKDVNSQVIDVDTVSVPDVGRAGGAANVGPDIVDVPRSNRAASMKHESPERSLSELPQRVSEVPEDVVEPPARPTSPTEAPSARTRERLGLWRHLSAFLKDWLYQHSDHPYPDEEEKRQICDVTGLSMRQLTNWLTNARCRIRAAQRSPALQGELPPPSSMARNRRSLTPELLIDLSLDLADAFAAAK